jgi:hypothetical protein
MTRVHLCPPDFLAFLNIGCVTTYSYFEKFSFAFAMIPTLLLAILAFYCSRRGTEGATNRSIKMALTALFLRWV